MRPMRRRSRQRRRRGERTSRAALLRAVGLDDLVR
jgi:hypothetical protein